jgi:predicted acetyltransferase
LATHGSPVAADPDVYDVAEFFVMRQYRRSGVGHAAAFLLWNRFPGVWTVRVSEGNAGAVSFWSDVVADFARGSATISSREGNPSAWRVFLFEVCE